MPVPEDVDEGGGLLVRRTERTGLEEVDLVVLAWGGSQRLDGGERSGESVSTSCRSEKGDGVSGVCERLEEENGGIKLASFGAGTDPVRRLGVEAEVITFCEPFEATIDDEVLALVATRESYFEIALAGIDGGGFVSDEEVLDVK